MVFQPGEEGYAGAYHMLKEGALDDVDAIISLHVLPSLPTGSIGSKAGPVLAGTGLFTATIKGVGAHGAQPHLSRDPILAASSAIVALQQIISRETDPLQSGVSFFSTSVHLYSFRITTLEAHCSLSDCSLYFYFLILFF